MHYKLITPRNNDFSPIEQILTNRGIPYEQIPMFLYTDDSVRNNPYDLANICSAANRILRAMIRQESIYIQVDSDCDGYTSAAVLINYLHRVFPSTVENNVSFGLHTKKHHGIAVENISDKCSLVIVPDASSNEAEIHQALASRGIDTVVLDHHHADINIDDPAIIVNNQMCSYENKNLSGVGIVYQLCKVLDDLINVSYADDFLDLVALGMVADMMDLRILETKRLIELGCSRIINPFFMYMRKKNDFVMKGKVNPFTISFYIAPFINAITRSGTDEEKRLIFESLLEHRAMKLVPSTKRGGKGQEELLVEQAIRVAGAVKKYQDDAKLEALDDLRFRIQSMDGDYGIIILQLEHPIDTNLTGLLANQIMAEYSAPVLILNKRINNETGEITWEGSGRGYVTDEVDDWRAYIEPHAIYAEGHAMAFGVGFTPEQLNNFYKHMSKVHNSMTFEKAYNVDFAFTMHDEFDDIIYSIAEHEEIWGQGVTQPNIVIKDIILAKDNIKLMGKGTLKIELGSNKTTCIKFNATDIYNHLQSMFPSDDAKIKITLVGSCQINDYNNYPQLKLIDYEINYIDAWGF